MEERSEAFWTDTHDTNIWGAICWRISDSSQWIKVRLFKPNCLQEHNHHIKHLKSPECLSGTEEQGMNKTILRSILRFVDAGSIQINQNGYLLVSDSFNRKKEMLCEAVLVVGILLPKCYHHNANTLTVTMLLLRWYLAGAADILSWTWITSKFTAIHLTVVEIFHSEAPPHTKSQEFILWGPWMSAPNSTATKQTRISWSHFHACPCLWLAGS